jgi:hypothetical protein
VKLSLTSKKSKRIEVESVGYRYQVSTTKIDDDWNFSLNLTLEPEEGSGRVLQARGLVTRDRWLDISGSESSLSQGDYPIILPRHIARFIKIAKANGWDSTETGNPFMLKVDNERFFK